jgi:hypothetical protein
MASRFGWLVYQQLSGDSGSGARVGSFESPVIGVGPQVGYLFPVSDKYQGYSNLKGYKEFASGHRADGWNTWLSFSISAAPPKQPKRSRCWVSLAIEPR